MTPLYRFRLQLPRGTPFGTPPTSGTLFGHLCWAVRAREGREGLEAFLAALPQAPTAVSDLFPAGYLPRPLLPTPESRVPDDLRKKLKRRRYLSRPAWEALRAAAEEAALEEKLEAEAADPPFFTRHRRAHHRLDHKQGKTAEEGGGPWFTEAYWPAAAEGARGIEADLYVQTPHPPHWIADLLAEVGARGYGRDATFGQGQFTVAGWEEEQALAAPPPGTGPLRFLSLSQGVITAAMRAPRWQRFVLFGKIGRDMMAEGLRPWKLPIVLARAGATFGADTPPPHGIFGAWLTGIHQDRPDIGHNAFHVSLPYREAAKEGAP
jgi:CRISPR-associated protein Csm4